MSKKIKLTLFLILILLLLLAYFLAFHNQASAPQTVVIKNPVSEADAQADLAENIPAATPIHEEPKLPETPPTKDSEEETPSEPAKPAATQKSPSPSAEKTAPDHAPTITKQLVSWGFSQASNRKIDTVIIHSSYNALGGAVYDLEKLIAEYQEYGVAPHYLIDRKGKIYQLVAEKNIAYHAGESKTPDGRSQVNNFSLGIELMNTQEDQYTSEQYSSLASLVAKIKSDYSIKYVLGHKDIAPGRKSDPWNFEWKKIK